LSETVPGSIIAAEFQFEHNPPVNVICKQSGDIW